MRKRSLTLNCTQEEVKYRLRSQMSPYALGGWVDDTQFKIYKHLRGIFAGNRGIKLLYCFYGEFRQSGKKIELIYQVRPGFSTWVPFSLIGCILLGALFEFLFMDGAIDSVIYSLVFLLLFYGIAQLQKKICISDFQAELTVEISRKNRRHL